MNRVAHVLRKYDPARWGGVETHVAALSAALAHHGVAAEVHAPKGPRAADTALRVPLHRYRAHLPFIGPADRLEALSEVGGNLISFDALRRLAFDTGLQLSHVHTQNRVGGVVRSAMRWTNRPYLVSVHGPLLSAQDYVSNEDQRRRAGTLDLGKPFGALVGSRRVLDDADRVIVFNDAELAAVRERVGDRAVRMDQGVDAARFSAGRRERAELRFPACRTAGPIVLVVGRLGAQKNQTLALEAFVRGAGHDATLIFAGAETDPGAAETLGRLAHAAGVRHRVHVLGQVAPSEMPDLLAAADLVMAPSLHEAFGLQVVESWAASTPALFARVGGLADLADSLEHDECALRDHDPDRWARALADTIASPARRAANAAEGGALVKARFDWDVVAARHAALYLEVLIERGRRTT